MNALIFIRDFRFGVFSGRVMHDCIKSSSYNIHLRSQNASHSHFIHKAKYAV